MGAGKRTIELATKRSCYPLTSDNHFPAKAGAGVSRAELTPTGRIKRKQKWGDDADRFPIVAGPATKWPLPLPWLG